jgi:hypothetical protein
MWFAHSRGLRKAGLCLVLFFSLGLLGCGGPSTGVVKGKVYYKDKVLKGGKVTFHSAERKGTAFASIAQTGEYLIENAPTGKVRITVSTESLNPRRSVGSRINKPPKDQKSPQGEKGKFSNMGHLYTSIPLEYADPEKSGLEYTVQGGEHEHDIKLTPK